MSRSGTLLALVAVVGGVLLAKVMGAGAREREARLQADVVAAVDDLWLQALDLGADRNRWPEVVFETWPENDLARTRCERPRPVIAVNARLLGAYDWYFREYGVPHELAHVMVCLDGSPDDWRAQHGDAWADWVRRLVPRDRAEEILAEQFEP